MRLFFESSTAFFVAARGSRSFSDDGGLVLSPLRTQLGVETVLCHDEILSEEQKHVEAEDCTLSEHVCFLSFT